VDAKYSTASGAFPWHPVRRRPSDLARHRVIESTINHHHLALYQRLHGIELVPSKPRATMPFDKHELKAIHRRLAQAGAQPAGSKAETPALGDY